MNKQTNTSIFGKLICLSLSTFASSSLLSAESTPAPTLEALPTYHVTGTHLSENSEALNFALTGIDSETLTLWSDLSVAEALRKETFSFGNSNTDNDSNGGTGSAGANLRGLGNLSTLTLINGRRAGGNSAFGFEHGGFADLNLTPSAAIREIQIVTDGTSVAYGSDAVSGTVNLLLHNTFTGNRVDASYSDTTDGDASEKNLSFLSGHALGEDQATHLVLLGSWYQRNAIYARDRDVSENADRRNQGGQNQSSSTYPGNIMVNYATYVLLDGITTPDTSAADILDNYRLRDPDTDFYNFSDSANAIPSAERTSAMANLSHQISEDLQIWSELLYTDSKFLNSLAPAPWLGMIFPGFEYYPNIVNAARLSPHLPGGIDPATINTLSYRSFELGTLDIEQDKEALRGLLGLRGQIGNWDWETAALYIQTKQTHTFSGIADERVLTDLIESGAFNPFASAFASGPAFDNAASLKLAESKPVNHLDEEFWSYDLQANGPIFELPAGEVPLALGLEFRREEIDVAIDELFESGANLGGIPQSSYAAQREVSSLFAETRIPLFSHDSHRLDLGLSARYENYKDKPADSAIQSNRYDAFVQKAALFYQPHEAVRMRAAFGTAFRAPTLTESYGGDQYANPIFNDPLGFTSNSARVTTKISGNPNLEPEESTHLNLGIEIEPDSERGWRLSIDYYRIETENAIVNGAQYFVNQNANAQAAGFGTPGNFDPDAAYADQISRGPTGALTNINANWFNAAEVFTDGIDYELSYTQPTDSGHWQASIGVNQVLHYEIKASANDAADSYLGKLVDPRAPGGNIIGRGSIPRYKGYARLLWAQEQLTLGLTLNYIHSLRDNPAFTTLSQARTVKSWTTFDAVVQYSWPSTQVSWLSGSTVKFGIENVTDQAPPFAAGAFADGYDSSLYSLAGRRLNLSLSRAF